MKILKTIGYSLAIVCVIVSLVTGLTHIGAVATLINAVLGLILTHMK